MAPRPSSVCLDSHFGEALFSSNTLCFAHPYIAQFVQRSGRGVVPLSELF
jgi:hypothetical protein